MLAQAAITNEYAWLPVQPKPYVAVTVKLNVPDADGKPLNVPSLCNANPAGKLPLVTAKVYGAVPPEAVMVCE